MLLVLLVLLRCLPTPVTPDTPARPLSPARSYDMVASFMQSQLRPVRTAMLVRAVVRKQTAARSAEKAAAHPSCRRGFRRVLG